MSIFDVFRRGGVRSGPAAMALSPAEAERVVQQYGLVLSENPVGWHCELRPVSSLPYPKERIWLAIKTLLPKADAAIVDSLVVGYASLADFIPDDDALAADKAYVRVYVENSRDLQAIECYQQLSSASSKEYVRLSQEASSFLSQ